MCNVYRTYGALDNIKIIFRVMGSLRVLIFVSTGSREKRSEMGYERSCVAPRWPGRTLEAMQHYDTFQN
jgi:hypothetical protein